MEKIEKLKLLQKMADEEQKAIKDRLNSVTGISADDFKLSEQYTIMKEARNKLKSLAFNLMVEIKEIENKQ